MAIIIKEATPEDAEKILKYTTIIGGETDHLSFGAEGMNLSVESERIFLQNNQNDKHSVFYCVWKESELIGTASLSGMPKRMSHRAEVSVSLLKKEWNKGIGSKLLNKTIEYAKCNGIEIIQLEVRSDNDAAIHLYRKFGFQKTGSIPAYFKIGKEYFDFDIMSLDLR